MTTTSRPWYKIRWQLWLTAIIVILASAYILYQTNKPIEISITSAPTGQNRTLKERMLFVVTLEKAFHKKGWLASMGVEGQDGKTLNIYWEQLGRLTINQMVKSQDTITELRDMGFKRLVFRNGKQEWVADLKN
jgi:hypothetical protein